MSEKREAFRHDTHMPGRIRPRAGGATLPCVICDLNQEGARLRVGHPELLPDTFDLLNLTTGEVLRVEARWRREGQIGVAVLDRDQIVICEAGAGPTA